MDQFTGTRPVAASHAFEVARLQAYLQAELPGFVGPLTVEQFKGGQSNPTYKLTTPGRAYVMRSKPGPVAKLLPSAHAIEREFRVMQALAASAVPVPQMLLLCVDESIIGRAFFVMQFIDGRVLWEQALHALAASAVPVPQMLLLCVDESIIGRAFFVMQFIDGRVLWEQALPALTRPERAAVYDEMNRIIAALHSVNVDAVGLLDYGKPGNYFDRQIGRWSKQFLASVTEPMGEMQALIEWLPENIPASARDETQVCIVHGDYRLDNLVFDSSQPQIRAVLDWELSTLGHPLADFSYHCLAWHIPPGTFRGIGGLDHAALGIPTEAEYVKLYCARTGRADPAAIMADWDFYLAYNLFRLASITQGIAKRVVDGTASSAQAKATGASTRGLAEMAWRFAQRAG